VFLALTGQPIESTDPDSPTSTTAAAA